MTPENTQRLFERFDHLYRGRYLPLTQNRMAEGFDCGDGWYDLIYQLSEQIEAYRQTHTEAVDLIVMQVKQKFGELRFYVQPRIPVVEEMIKAAGERSRRICELTGQPGVRCFRDEYYCTLSPEKAQELGFRLVQSTSQ